MTPEIALLLAQYALKYVPSFVLQIEEILTKPNPTREEVRAIFTVMQKYDEEMAEANLRAGRSADAPVTLKPE